MSVYTPEPRAKHKLQLWQSECQYVLPYFDVPSIREAKATLRWQAASYPSGLVYQYKSLVRKTFSVHHILDSMLTMVDDKKGEAAAGEVYGSVAYDLRLSTA